MWRVGLLVRTATSGKETYLLAFLQGGRLDNKFSTHRTADFFLFSDGNISCRPLISARIRSGKSAISSLRWRQVACMRFCYLEMEFFRLGAQRMSAYDC